MAASSSTVSILSLMAYFTLANVLYLGSCNSENNEKILTFVNAIVASTEKGIDVITLSLEFFA